MSAALRIVLLPQGGEQREADKEPGNALAGHLAHRDGPTATGQYSDFIHRYYSGSARHRRWCSNPAWSVSCRRAGPTRGLRRGLVLSGLLDPPSDLRLERLQGPRGRGELDRYSDAGWSSQHEWWGGSTEQAPTASGSMKTQATAATFTIERRI